MERRVLRGLWVFSWLCLGQVWAGPQEAMIPSAGLQTAPETSDATPSRQDDATPAAKPLEARVADPLSPAVVTRMVERQRQMDELEGQILRQRAVVKETSSPALRSALDNMEERYAKLHGAQLWDGLTALPLQIPFGLTRVFNRALDRMAGDPESAGTWLKPKDAPGIGQLREVLENARDFPTAVNIVRRMIRDTNESQAKLETEIQQLRQKRRSAEERDDEAQEKALNDRLRILLAERQYYRTIKTSGVSFLITHGGEIPGGLGLMARGVARILAGDLVYGAADVAHGLAIASPAGMDYGCWAGQCVVWGPTSSAANGSREILVGKVGPALKKLLFAQAPQTSAEERLRLMSENGATDLVRLRVKDGATELGFLNKEGKVAIQLHFAPGEEARHHLSSVEAFPLALPNLDMDAVHRRLRSLGWDVQDAVRQITNIALDPETRDKHEKSQRSYLGRITRPAIGAGEAAFGRVGSLYRGVKRHLLGTQEAVQESEEVMPSFIQPGSGISDGERIRFAIQPGKVRVEPTARQLKAPLKALARGLAPVGQRLGPSVRDGWEAVGAGIELTGEVAHGAIVDGLRLGQYASGKARRVARAIASSSLGKACFEGFKQLSVSAIRER